MPGAATGRATWLAAPGAGPNLRLGLRTTLASVPPLLAAAQLHEPALIWMALGGLYVNMADTGGAYRTKATAMGLASLLGALALGGGIGLAAWPWLCVPAMAAVALGCGMLALYGNSGALIGLVTAWCFLIGINVSDPDPAKALAWSLLYLAGGGWATLLALALWPLRPYRPVRIALAAAHRAVARYHRLACPADGGPPATEAQLFTEKLRVRDALGSARATLADTRSGRLGASPADGAFTRLIETTDALFVTSAALGDLLAALPAPAATPLHRRLQALNGRCVDALLQLEQALLGRGPLPALRELREELEGIAAEIEDLEPALRDAYRQILANQAHWIATQDGAGEAIPLTALSPTQVPTALAGDGGRAAFAQGWATLRANLTLESSVFRHGLRFGVASAAAVAVYTLFALPIGYWITLTVSVILRPSAGESLSRTGQRVLGTVLGGILAIVLATCFPHPLMLVLLLVPLTLVMMAVLPVNYGLFVFFLTPWIVLYKDINQPGDWNLALWRIANTLIGAALALAAIHLVLPRWERSQLPARLAASLRCNARFVQQVLDRLQEPPQAAPGPLATPAEVRLEMGNAHVSIQRFLSEKPAHRAMAVPLMAFLLHSQRLIDAAVVLGRGDPRRDGRPLPPGFGALRERLPASLAALATALEQHTRPPDPPERPRPATGGAPLARQLGRLVDPVIGLHDAVAAWSDWQGLPAAAPRLDCPPEA